MIRSIACTVGFTGFVTSKHAYLNVVQRLRSEFAQDRLRTKLNKGTFKQTLCLIEGGPDAKQGGLKISDPCKGGVPWTIFTTSFPVKVIFYGVRP